MFKYIEPYLFTQERRESGEAKRSEKVRGAIFYKRGQKYRHDRHYL
jgi:hypothetical protein